MAYNTWEAIYTSTAYAANTAWNGHVIQAEADLILTGIRIRRQAVGLAGGFEIWTVVGSRGVKTFGTRLLAETAGTEVTDGGNGYSQLTGQAISLTNGLQYVLVFHRTAGWYWYTGAGYRSTAEFTTISGSGGIDNYYQSAPAPMAGTALDPQLFCHCFEIYYEAAAPAGRPRRWVCII